MFNPRPNQAQILAYQQGRMGISAVPGSGKTHTLSYLAAQLLVNSQLDVEQEILVVTLVNSAVDNFTTRIAGFVKDYGLLENVGYRVRTLHGLAHDIILERPDMAGLSSQFSIVDDLESDRMIERICEGYIRLHPELAGYLLKPDVDVAEVSRIRNGWPELITSINQNFIRKAKDLQAEPQDILTKLQEYHYGDPLMEMGIEVYQQYQRGLRYRNAIDFADLIRLAFRVLDCDPEYLERLRYRWPYILEDEAQDSSRIQEQMLRKLVGDDGNWVRVGDPNQAIYESFTTASPRYLREFLKEKDVKALSLPHSGRSNLGILNLANALINWTKYEHPVVELRSALDHPLIEPTPSGDPQPNPEDHPNSVFIHPRNFSPDQEIKTVVENIKRWLPENHAKTVAVLCPIGWYGEQVADALHAAEIPMVELLKSTEGTRRVAAIIENILIALNDPTNALKFSKTCSMVLKKDDLPVGQMDEIAKLMNAIRKINRLEDLIYPRPGMEIDQVINFSGISDEVREGFVHLLSSFARWHLAVSLPIDQLVLTISQDLFTSPAELALTHKFALLLEFNATLHPEFGLADFALELSQISSNLRKFNGFSDEELRFNPDDHKGQVFVSTYHKAKGLEWDRVYLMSVNNYDFPSAQKYDTYHSEKWFIRKDFDPHAETLDRLTGLLTDDENLINAQIGSATQRARLEYSSERLRLLFVGITRARESLVITWNTGRKDQKMALSLAALYGIWKGQHEPA
jgi:DNA helicase-2/ATP-dependent DNA helicase PcrA